MYFLLLIVIVITGRVAGQYSSGIADNDAYGLKISGNDIMLIEALVDTQIFVIRFSPYDDRSESVQCSIMYNDSSQYIYSIGIGRKQNSSQRYFYYAGETKSKKMSNRNSLNDSSTFIGILINKNFENEQFSDDRNQFYNCNYFQYESIQFISAYEHQEFFVFSVEPFGQYAIGLAKDFLFIYRPFSSNKILLKNSHLVWPSNTIYLPIAADTNTFYTIVAGFVLNGPLVRIRATPTIYVISNNDLSLLAMWSYTAIIHSWQSYLTYSNLKRWSNEYIMSVKINPDDSNRVLVGMPFLNIVFLLDIHINGTNITLNSFIDNGDSIGFGKSVAWLANSQVAILSTNSPKNDSSKVYLYKSLNKNKLPSSPSFIYPNIQQNLPNTINRRFIRMISTPNSLVILNINGEIIHILTSPPGYYSSTSSSNDDSIIVVSQSLICMAGTYKIDDSIFPCQLCPSGSRNSGNNPSISCQNCTWDSFCPVGSVTDIDKNNLSSHSQAHVHPRSPEVTVFDEILLQNMFSTSSNDHCLIISPLFWVLIVIGFVCMIWTMMLILKRCVRHPRGHRVRHHVKKIFRQTDLINEGEMWVGGLLSFAIVVLLIFAFTFSASFYQEYPREDSGPSTLACGEVVRNAKYESGLQSLSIPVSEEEQPLFDLLNRQLFTITLDLLNTYISCKSLIVQQIVGLSTEKLTPNCTQSNGILSATIQLSYKKVLIKWIFNDIALIGAVRFTLLANGEDNKPYYLKELDFSQTFYDTYNQTLAQTTNYNLELTKAINETEPLSGHHSKFSGIWYPTFTIDHSEMFISADEYQTSAYLTSTTLTMLISETSYYIKNRQLPIAKLREIIFHNLLFTIVSIEIFRLIILLFKLTIFPLITTISQHFRNDNDENLTADIETVDHDTTTDDLPTTTTTITDDIHTTTTTDDLTTITDDETTITAKDYNIIQLNL